MGFGSTVTIVGIGINRSDGRGFFKVSGKLVKSSLSAAAMEP